ncbi:hypothetical protein [Sinorhizobium sojae]|uniref:hypothetical protein n=1 Tax=Sinorhizobium sojae TaxID=716925 RepID=UPI0006820070|nr:hypothetical protein [Sinorhizobium sojae]
MEPIAQSHGTNGEMRNKTAHQASFVRGSAVDAGFRRDSDRKDLAVVLLSSWSERDEFAVALADAFMQQFPTWFSCLAVDF